MRTWLEKWSTLGPVVEPDEEEAKNCLTDVSKPMCKSYSWAADVERFEKKPQDTSYSGYEITVYYQRMEVKLISEERVMTMKDLFQAIGICTCIWFVLLHIIYYIVSAFKCCLCKKKEEEKINPTDRCHAPMTDLVQEKEVYQQTEESS